MITTDSITSDQLAEMYAMRFSPNKLVTLLGNPYSSKEEIRDCFLHTLRVIQRRVFGRYDSTPIKHFSVCESDRKTKPHIHSLVVLDTDILPIDKWMILIREVWMGTNHGSGLSLTEDKHLANETWFKDVYELEGVVGYCVKKSAGTGDDFLFCDRQY